MRRRFARWWARCSRRAAPVTAVLRPHTLRRYAQAAGFRALAILPIPNDFWRFYRFLF